MRRYRIAIISSSLASMPASGVIAAMRADPRVDLVRLYAIEHAPRRSWAELQRTNAPSALVRKMVARAIAPTRRPERAVGARLRVRSWDDRALADDLDRSGVEVILNGGGIGIVPREFLRRHPRVPILNIHSGLVPSYRGVDALWWAALQGEFDHFAQACHRVTEEIDAGPAYVIRHLGARDLAPHRSIGALQDALLRRWPALYLAALERVDAGATEGAAGESRQYYAMHPTLRVLAEHRYRAHLTALDGATA